MFNKKVCVVGIGYVGLPCALMLAQSGCKVTGVDVDDKRVQELQEGKAVLEKELQDIFEASEVRQNFCASNQIGRADVFVIAVPTPIDEDRKTADLTALKGAVESIAGVLKEGNLVIIDSHSCRMP